jgi:hypothetical protein
MVACGGGMFVIGGMVTVGGLDFLQLTEEIMQQIVKIRTELNTTVRKNGIPITRIFCPL